MKANSRPLVVFVFQNELINIFNGNYSSYDKDVESKADMESLKASVELLAHEKLQIHMDCMNAVGEIITVDDVDDLGGAVSWID
jgi:hypothetical protein